jgi:hypothetical protein
LTGEELLPAKFASPPYTAVMLCDPRESVLRVKLAVPLASKIAFPRLVLLSMKLTVPVGVPLPLEVTWAVKVTLFSSSTDVELVCSATAEVLPFTVTLTAEDVLPAKFVSPLYTAVMLCDPRGSVLRVKTAAPLASNVAFPKGVLPSMKVTLPVGVPLVLEATVALKVTLSRSCTVAALVCSVVVVLTLSMLRLTAIVAGDPETPLAVTVMVS